MMHHYADLDGASETHFLCSMINQKHYPDLGSASDWLCHMVNLIQPIRSTTQIWVLLLIGRATW